MSQCSVWYEQEEYKLAAQKLATNLGLALNQELDPKSPRLLVNSQISLELEGLSLAVDFSKLRLRLGKYNEPLARAVKAKDKPTIIDATAGLGYDGFMLASFGSKVHMVEQNSLIFTLLEDALRRAKQIYPELTDRISLNCADSCSILAKNKFEVVYLDPMFGPQKRLAPKELQILRQLDTASAPELFELAMQSATKRLVIKRKIREAYLGGNQADFSLRGTKIRYDIYLKN